MLKAPLLRRNIKPRKIHRKYKYYPPAPASPPCVASYCPFLCEILSQFMSYRISYWLATSHFCYNKLKRAIFISSSEEEKSIFNQGDVSVKAINSLIEGLGNVHFTAQSQEILHPKGIEFSSEHNNFQQRVKWIFCESLNTWLLLSCWYLEGFKVGV